MNENVCSQCGAPLAPGVMECKFCGEKVAQQQMQQPMQQQMQQPMQQQMQPMYGNMQAVQPQTVYVQQPIVQQVYTTGINPTWPIKSKIAAGVLGIFLGGLGIHKFYLGRVGTGVLYLLFCWTGIPAFVGFIEGIVYLCSNDENFQLKHQVRIR